MKEWEAGLDGLLARHDEGERLGKGWRLENAVFLIERLHADRGALLDLLRRVAEVGIAHNEMQSSGGLFGSEWPQVDIGQCYDTSYMCRFCGGGRGELICGGKRKTEPEHLPGCPAPTLKTLREPPCHCAETSTRNCPRHQNGGENQ